MSSAKEPDMNVVSKTVKCVIWDLDNTLWNGVLLEDDEVAVLPGIVDVIKTLDGRGILHSIASRNDHERAMAKLSELGLEEYFLFPQITWGPKSVSVETVAKNLNLATNAMAFVDDDPFERDEVAAGVPGVLCIDAADAFQLPDFPELQPRFVSEETAQRRLMYRAEIRREEAAAGLAPEQFLRSLGMVFSIAEADERDLARVEELAVRTNQLNSTGITYSFSELQAFRQSPDYILLVAGLEDRYGSYGKIGIALIEKTEQAWLLRLLLMSCRVMSRGVGKVLLSYILQQAAGDQKRVVADFVRTPRNRAMYLTFKLAGFKEFERDGNIAHLEHDLSIVDPFPDFVEVRIGA
jgi:FkbH-like protein